MVLRCSHCGTYLKAQVETVEGEHVVDVGLCKNCFGMLVDVVELLLSLSKKFLVSGNLSPVQIRDVGKVLDETEFKIKEFVSVLNK